jgi:hypothetical protein
MKTILVIAMMLFGAVSLTTLKAQVNVNVNIGVQPLWGPVGYDYVEFYYLPRYEVYYYVPTAQFVYFHNGVWVYTSSLPSRYGRVDLYRTHKVVINQPHAYKYHPSHRSKYGKYHGARKQQVVIRDSRDTKYTSRKDHPHSNTRGNAHKKGGPPHGRKGPGKGR